MSVNDLTFNQLSTVLGDIVNQATGKSAAIPTNTNEFVTVAQTALKTGYDPLATAISQVLSRNIFSNRPYYRKFRGLEADAIRYGNHVRKINAVDKPFEEDDRFKLVDGESIDQYKVNKPKALQTNFYGYNVWQKSMTIYRDQLDNAFQSEDGFRGFLGMMMGNAQDMIEQAHENTARATIANLIGGTVSANNSPQIVHLVTDYKAFIRETDPTFNVYDPANFPMFARWLFGRIKTLSQSMEERSYIYHVNVTDNEIARHSPVRDQRFYIFTPEINTIDATVLSNTFNDEYLKLLPYEGVTFWQAISEPKKINVNCSYMDNTGAIVEGSFESDKVLGVILDREAAGYTVANEWAQPTPFNARGGYYNQYWHFTDRYWNDFSENAVVLMLD